MERFINQLIVIVCMILMVASCQQVPLITMTGPLSYTFTRDGGIQSVSFACNRDWSVSSTESWITVSPSKGSATEGETKITIICSPNTTYDTRTATITVKTEDLSEHITITQDTGLGLIVSPKTFELTNAEQTIDIEVQKNVQYTVSIDDDSSAWIKQGGTKALTTDRVTFSIAANTSYDNREGKIVFKQLDGNLTETVSIRQSQTNGLFITTPTYDLSNETHALSVEVKANVEFDITSQADWIKLVGTKALTPSTVTLTIEANESYDNRTGTVLVKQTNGDLSGIITINQKQTDYLTVTPTSFSVSSQTQTVEVEVKDNVSYSVVIPDDAKSWISAFSNTQTKALKDDKITLSIAQNTTYDDREASVTIKQTDGPLTETVNIKQEGKDDISGVENLSKNETANCYVVEKEGKYSFNASIIGNGDKGIMPGFGFHTINASISPVKAKLLWQDNDIISNIELRQGRVFFSASSQKGNAVIAVTDENDTILWSWHIWATEPPLSIQLTPSTHSYLDRNLGALSCNPEDASSVGLYYQWGRKDPLHPGYSNTIDKPYPLTIQFLLQNPTAIPRDNSIRWVSADSNGPNLGLWGNPDGEKSIATHKTIYDPCPIGYTIPADDAWYEYGYTGNPDHCYASQYDSSIVLLKEQDGITASKNGKAIFYPIVHPLFNDSYSGGLYYRNSWYLNQGIVSVGAFFDEGFVIPNYGCGAEAALQVRCIKEEIYDSYPPTVETLKASSVKISDLVLNGKVISNGNSFLTARGFYWGYSQNNLNNRIDALESQSGFRICLEDLQPHSTIFYRAFAENKSGIGYGKMESTKLLTATEYSISVLDSLSRFMTAQYLHIQGMNGEGTIRHWYGNLTGNYMSHNQTGWAPLYNLDYLNRGNSSYDRFPLFYYYRIINKINATIDDYIPFADQSDPDINHYKAALLGYRAYAYTMLVQIYCQSWDNSNNGSSPGLPLRINAEEDVTQLSTLAAVYQQIYSDLDTALSLLTSSSIARKTVNEMDIHVIYAIYAKAALNKKDYDKAALYAQLARANSNLMSNSEYQNGFNSNNNEWIWGAHPDNQSMYGLQLYYYSFFSYLSSNSDSSISRSYPKCISKELFEKIPTTDIRRTLFLDPLNYSYNNTSGKANSDLTSYAFSKYSINTSHMTVDGWLYSTSTIYAYMQFKFRCLFYPGGGQMNFIRAAEMVLIEAEANYYLGKEEETRNLLNYLNNQSGRDNAYNCTASGAALLEELKFYRALELWGEGFDWFDLKRWGEPVSRKSFAEGGNFPEALAGTWTSSEKYDFTWTLPDDYESVIRNVYAY